MTMSVVRRMGLFLVCAATAVVLAQAQQAPKDSKAKDTQPAKVASAAQKPVEDPAAVLLKDAANAGFKPEHIRGNLMFCRTTTEVGSRFPVRTCYDEDHVRAKIQEYQAQRDQLERERNIPSPCFQKGGTNAGAATC
ncbi:MAG TPA: hypothetical protein VFW10_16370 [Steroidobacteraceae bacterium]|nr:hypothetical protein [Steroidobacteraceae bacterium]